MGMTALLMQYAVFIVRYNTLFSAPICSELEPSVCHYQRVQGSVETVTKPIDLQGFLGNLYKSLTVN